MINNDTIKEHSPNGPASLVSNVVIAPKPDASITITLNVRNVNKAIIGTTHPILQHKDIKAKLAGCKILLKMDFKSFFWQIESDKFSRYLTVFHTNNKLF